MKKSLPIGLSFPLDFGFIPHTKAEDGDPMDVMIFMEEPGFPGCMVECRVIGIITAEQQKKKKLIRNDRVLAVAVQSDMHAGLKHVADISKPFLEDLTQFLEAYRKKDKDNFKVLGVADAEKAIKLIKENLILWT